MMKLTEDQYELIRPLMLVQRRNVRIGNLKVLNAVLCVAENGCTWGALPARFGNWHTIYSRLRRWAAAGVLDRVFQALQGHRLIRILVERVGLDGTGWQRRPTQVPLVMDRAYEGDETWQLVLQLGFEPVAPPHPNRRHPWTYDRSLYRRRNEGRAPVPPAQRLSPHLLPLREARPDVHHLHPLRADRRHALR